MLKHVPGSKMGKVDSLSRRSDWKVGVEKDNEDKILVKPEWLEVRKMKKVEVIVEGVDLLEKMKQSRVKDNEMIKAVEEIKQAGVKILRDEEQREVDSIMYKERKMYILRDEKLRIEIIWLHHDTPVGGYRGQQKMIELVTRKFWWPGVIKEVKQYMEGYNTCQHNKNHTEQLAEKLMPNSIPEKPWAHISADFITKLLLAQGYNSILVVVDRLTKMVHFIPTTEKTSVEELARLFRDNVWKLHRLPRSIISDRGPQFVAGVMWELNRMLEIESKLSMAFYSQTNGQTERVNQELEQYLRMFIDYRQEQWPEQLGTAEFAYNNKTYSSTKTLPFKANYRQDPRIGFEVRKKRKYKGAEKFVTKMKEIQEKAKAVLGKAQEKIKKYVDRKRTEVDEYKEEDLVMLSTKDLKYQMVERRMEKLTERFVGPYRIKKIILPNTVELELPSTVKIHLVVNVSRIQRYVRQVEGQRKKQPAPVIIEGEKEQKIERILNKQQIKGKDKYLVQQKGFMAESNTWEGIENLGNAKETVEKFEKEYWQDMEDV